MEETASQNHRDFADDTNFSAQVNSNSSPNDDANKTSEESKLKSTINTKSSEALAKALSCMLTSVIKDFDSKAQDTLHSQDHLASSIDRLTRELDQLLEDAPLPFIMQHAAKISSIRKRVSAMNSVLRSIQQRIDNLDRMLSAGLHHGTKDATRFHPSRKQQQKILDYINFFKGFLEPRTQILKMPLETAPSFCPSKFEILKTWLHDDGKSAETGGTRRFLW